MPFFFHGGTSNPITPLKMNMQTENTPNGKGKSSEPNHFQVLYVNPIFGGCIQEKGSPNRIPLRFLAPSNFPLRTRETERHQSRNCSYIDLFNQQVTTLPSNKVQISIFVNNLEQTEWWKLLFKTCENSSNTNPVSSNLNW